MSIFNMYIKVGWGGEGGGGLECEVVQLKPFYTTLNFWYRTDKIGTRTTFLWAGDIIFIA